MTTTIYKQLATNQDVVKGKGKVRQRRNGRDVDLDKLNFDERYTQIVSDIPSLIADSELEVGDYVSTYEYHTGTGVGGADYVVTDEDPGYLGTVNQQLANGLYLKYILNDSIKFEQAGARGDLDTDLLLDSVGNDIGGNNGTDDTVAIQAALDFSKNVKTRVCTDPFTGSISTRSLFGGGQVTCEQAGVAYRISDTLTLTCRTIVDLNNNALVADTSAAWQDIEYDMLDWIHVVNGGSGYTSAPTVNISSGDGETATAVAIVQGGEVIGVYVRQSGIYSTPPTITLSGGGGSGAVVEPELMTLGQPMIDNVPAPGVFAPGTSGFVRGQIWCRQVCDGMRLISCSEHKSSNLNIQTPKHSGMAFLGADRNDFFDIVVRGSGKYGIVGLCNPNVALRVGAQEDKFFGGNLLWCERACVRLTNGTNSWVFTGVTVRQNKNGAASGYGSEFVMSAGNSGHILRDVKIEHSGNNPKPVIVTCSGEGYYVGVNYAPNAPQVHYKWVHNVGANNVVIDLIGSKSVMDARVDNPQQAGDISPFASEASNGIVCQNTPYSTQINSFFDWCRDMNGNIQGGSKFRGAQYVSSQTGSRGMLTDEVFFEGQIPSTKSIQGRTLGDSEPKWYIQANGRPTFKGLSTHLTNAAAIAAGRVQGDFYIVSGTDPAQVAVVI